MIKVFGATFVLFAVLDFIWLGFVMKEFNMRQLAEIGRIENGVFQLMYLPAIIVYVLMAAGFTVFVYPQLSLENGVNVFLKSALMGLVVYGVYDMTNLAILKNYPLPFALVDMAWGSFAFGAVGLIVKKFGSFDFI